ncbi:nodulation protein NfeD [Azoarcus sp. KH32C]|uniref:NfeD family protein n=1 Tax=Azoarcus sp. KH32C TaxID=748247 RepID=UPI0002386CEF|nr:nodulation protein NfeD [Azoarcus sp. KH32C]BAL26567.1 nodulation efficiency protein D [Azoarcus sp. KH32C]
MRRIIWALVALGLLIIGFLLIPRPVAGAPATGPAVVLRIDGVIGPATADFVTHQLARAAERHAELAVLAMDTPGGLDTAMRAIIKDILSSPIPIVAWVGPKGARAASAGTYILYASHVAAMAPATNLGAATPVAIGLGGGRSPGADDGDKASNKDQDRKEHGASGDTMMEKARNDAAAYIRSLAQLRGRNADFAERAVRDAASLSAEDALAGGVIELIAQDEAELLAKLDGRTVKLSDGTTRHLATASITVERVTPDWRNRLLSLISNPQLALILMMIGIYGLYFEFTTPGTAVPGVTGLICLMLALYAFHLLPVNWAGVALLLVGASMMIAEAFLPSFGALGVGGIVAFVIGGLFLMDTDAPGYGIPLGFLIGLSTASAALLFAVGSFAARTRRQPVVSGRENMIGAVATVRSVTPDGTWAFVQGESWRVSSPAPLVPGARVRVVGLDGLTLRVEPLASTPDTTLTEGSPS